MTLNKFYPIKIRKYGDPVLREAAEPVIDKNSKRVKEISENLKFLCKQQNGLGLAAPQIGISERIIVIDMTHYGGDFYTMINPKIISSSTQKFYTQEGCLSIPDLYVEIARPKECIIEYYDLNSRKREIKANGILSTVVHHEIDHLDGILFIDRIDDEQYKNQILASLVLKNFNH